MIQIETNFIYVKCNDQQARQLDAIWVKSRNAFRLPNTLGALRELYKMGFDTLEEGKRRAAAKEDLLRLKTAEVYSNIGDLRPYQHQDIHFLSQLPHCGVFNDPRTGKSVTVLKLMEIEDRKKNLIVCPASLVLNWTNEITKWTNKTPFPVNGNKTKRMKIYNEFKAAEEGYLIMSKEALRSDVEIIETL
jgi:SNF2 family DNA or RNA helicase